MLPAQSQILELALAKIASELVPAADPRVVLERPKVAEHGDLATNLAMQLSKPAGQPPPSTGPANYGCAGEQP